MVGKDQYACEVCDQQRKRAAVDAAEMVGEAEAAGSVLVDSTLIETRTNALKWISFSDVPKVLVLFVRRIGWGGLRSFSKTPGPWR